MICELPWIGKWYILFNYFLFFFLFSRKTLCTYYVVFSEYIYIYLSNDPNEVISRRTKTRIKIGFIYEMTLFSSFPIWARSIKRNLILQIRSDFYTWSAVCDRWFRKLSVCGCVCVYMLFEMTWTLIIVF